MSTYSFHLVDGHILAKIENKIALVDTGAPHSVGTPSPWTVAGKSFPLTGNYLGVTPQKLSEFVGSRVDILLGADILGEFDLTINLREQSISLEANAVDFKGEPFSIDDFMGIPIVTVKIAGESVRAFFDTGAKLSYLDPDLASGFPQVGEEQDFYPGLGKFVTRTHRVDFKFGNFAVPLTCGILPELLQMTLMMADTRGIVGTEFLKSFDICLSSQRKKIILRKVGG